MSEFPSLKDHFLIAMPNLIDLNFYRSVTYIIEHNEEGAMGIVINQPLEADLKQLLEHLNIHTKEGFVGNKKLMSGGPVQIERGFIVHTPYGHWQSSMRLSQHIAVTTSPDILTAISENKGPENVEVILGYAGWEAGQLDQEILQNSWLSVPANAEVLFHTPVEKRWQAAAELIGIDITQLTTEAGHC